MCKIHIFLSQEILSLTGNKRLRSSQLRQGERWQTFNKYIGKQNNMQIEQIILEIKKSIEEAQRFSKDLGGVSSISRNYLESKLNNITPTEIHLALLELNENKEIEYSSNSDVIIIKYSKK